MISGQHLGELVRLVLQKLKDCDILFQDHWTDELGTGERFYTKYVSEVLRFVYIIISLDLFVFDSLLKLPNLCNRFSLL
jgi:hypothetical protein